MTQEEALKRIENVVDKLKYVLLCKNRDYGNSAFTTPALLPNLPPASAILVRLSDKIARLQTLADQDYRAQVADERFRDTIVDLAGYAVLYLAATEENETQDMDDAVVVSASLKNYGAVTFG